MLLASVCVVFFFFKQKTAYEMRISDWSSDVCSSDLALQQGDIEADNFILKGPKLVLARRARIVGGAATLGDALLDPSSTTVAAAIAQRGLKHWEADPDADLVIGACGA